MWAQKWLGLKRTGEDTTILFPAYLMPESTRPHCQFQSAIDPLGILHLVSNWAPTMWLARGKAPTEAGFPYI